MEVTDGFIKDVYRYCDLWCQECALSHRCEAVAGRVDLALEEARHLLAGPTPLEECHLPLDLERSTAPDPAVIVNSSALRKKFREVRLSDNPAVRQALKTIEHFMVIAPMKMMRALSAVSAAGPGDQQSDAQGSGKVALLGLGRMAEAWRILLETRHFSEEEAAPFLSEISRLTRNVERALPNARAFVRPGFDEAAEVALLDAGVRRH
jgi:ribosomal protein L30/L7E